MKEVILVSIMWIIFILIGVKIDFLFSSKKKLLLLFLVLQIIFIILSKIIVKIIEKR